MLERRGGSVEMLPPGLNQVRLSWARPRHPRRSYVDRSLCQGARAPSVYALALQSGSRFDSPSLSRSISAGGDVINSLLFSPFHLFLSLMLMIDWLCILLYLMKNNLFCTTDTWLMFLLVCFCLKSFCLFLSFRVNSNECTFIVQIFSGNQTVCSDVCFLFSYWHSMCFTTQRNSFPSCFQGQCVWPCERWVWLKNVITQLTPGCLTSVTVLLLTGGHVERRARCFSSTGVFSEGHHLTLMMTLGHVSNKNTPTMYCNWTCVPGLNQPLTSRPGFEHPYAESQINPKPELSLDDTWSTSSQYCL